MCIDIQFVVSFSATNRFICLKRFYAIKFSAIVYLLYLKNNLLRNLFFIHQEKFLRYALYTPLLKIKVRAQPGLSQAVQFT
jgi:hypothetical protein